MTGTAQAAAGSVRVGASGGSATGAGQGGAASISVNIEQAISAGTAHDPESAITVFPTTIDGSTQVGVPDFPSLELQTILATTTIPTPTIGVTLKQPLHADLVTNGQTNVELVGDGTTEALLSTEGLTDLDMVTDGTTEVEMVGSLVYAEISTSGNTNFVELV